MKNSVVAFSGASVLAISLIIIATFKTGIVSALTATTIDATSTASDTTTASTSPASASTTPATDASSTSPTQPVQTQAPPQTQAQAQPASKPTLKLVHVVGTKYIDYFTDGTKTYSFPGNPDIDSNLNKPNAPIPAHGNLKWLSTSGMDAYNTSRPRKPTPPLQPPSNLPANNSTTTSQQVPLVAVCASTTRPRRRSSG